jgi:uncharacterized protein YehS (DUF1456 family)
VLANDCLKKIRYILDLNDSAMMNIFADAGQEISREELSNYLKKEDDTDYVLCSDPTFATFLNGLIISKRGKKEGALPETEAVLNNNIIFRKLKIAFNLQAEEILAILATADFQLSKHELSAFFRRPEHKHYRECKDQILRNFLMGLQLRLRGQNDTEDERA